MERPERGSSSGIGGYARVRRVEVSEREERQLKIEIGLRIKAVYSGVLNISGSRGDDWSNCVLAGGARGGEG